MNKHVSENLPEQLYTARECREIDHRVISSGKIAGFELMSRAGQFTFDCIFQQYPDVRHMVILCGSGNNGGDGYIVAGLASNSGISASVYAYGPPTTDDSVSARAYAEKQGSDIYDCLDKPDLSEKLSAADVIVDALLGTGVDREVSGYLAQIISWVNHSKKPVFACDIPTGLNSDTGRVMGHCIAASATPTFIALKAGLFTGSGKAQSGHVRFSNLGVSADHYSSSKPCALLLNRRMLSAIVHQRIETAHKGITGYSGIAGGAPGMTGAVIMAASAAYRSGCGRVMVLTHPDHSSNLALAVPEILTHGCSAGSDASRQISQFNAIAVGPGLGQTRWAMYLFNQVMQSGLPMVVDADGLNLLSSNKARSDNWILTPHPGEAARLLNCSTADIQNDRFAAAGEIVNQYGGVCVLKGSGTLVAADDRLTRVCRAGNSGQATAGMGDVLTGCIVGFVAQGYELFDAACLGTWCHSAAADCEALSSGKIGIMATDLLRPIQKLHNELLHAKIP